MQQKLGAPKKEDTLLRSLKTRETERETCTLRPYTCVYRLVRPYWAKPDTPSVLKTHKAAGVAIAVQCGHSALLLSSPLPYPSPPVHHLHARHFRALHMRFAFSGEGLSADVVTHCTLKGSI